MSKIEMTVEQDCATDIVQAGGSLEICSGDMLSKARQASGRSIAEMAELTCIRSDYLEAMESGDRDSLPERAFTLGFVRAYADALDLDCNEVVSAFKAEFDEVVVRRPEVDSALIARHNTSKPWFVGFALPVVAAVFFYAGMPAFEEAQSATPMMAEMPSGAEMAAADVQPAPADPGRMLVSEVVLAAAGTVAENRQQVHSARNSMVLVAKEDSWLQLTSSEGRSIWSGVLLAGESRTQPVKDAVYLTTGNAGGLSLEWGERTPHQLGERGAVVREMALTPALLGSRVTENLDARP